MSLSTHSDEQLQQKAYPSAAAFDQATPEQPSSQAFGATISLPRAGTSQPETKTPTKMPGNMPAISLDRVQDTALRQALENKQVEQTPFSPNISAVASAPVENLAPNSPFGDASTGIQPDQHAVSSASSPFEPLRTPEQEPIAPLTSGIPLVSTQQSAISATGMQQGSYPSVSPATTSIPKVEPKNTRGGWVSSSLRSFVRADPSLTAPIRGLGRIAQRQFSLSTRRDREKLVQEKEQARDVLNFTLRLAETMFHYGADAMDVDSAIVAVCSAYGLEDVEVDITNQSVIINYVSDVDGHVEILDSRRRTLKEERFSHTVVRVVRSTSDNYASLADIYRLIHKITHRGIDREEAEKTLNAINAQKKPYSPMVVWLANIIAAGTLTMGIGGSGYAAALSAMVWVIVHFITRIMNKMGMPSFFNMAACAAVITFVAIYATDDGSILHSIGLNVSGPHIVAAGLIMLLPTFRLVSAVQDAINGFPVTAAGRFVSTGMSFLGLVVGLASGVTVLSITTATTIDVSQSVFAKPTIVDNIFWMTVATLAIAITTHARLKTLWWIALVTLSGLSTYHVYTFFLGEGAGRGNTAVAAFVIGMVSTYLAYRLHAPQAIFAIPSLTFLLPGLSLFRGMYSFTVETDTLNSMPGVITAAAIIVAMASGVALGHYLMQWLIQRFGREREDLSTTVFDR
ncbi:threonine/serine exporter family protein [Rothia sp. CCM 9419]|uniref:threonine/serine exporter family protein n=1 Tax=Rothia sp. CCM 9419 TaxID=3402662 RepID=UPI003AD805FC